MARKVEGIKNVLQIVASEDVAGNTVAEVLENFALQYEDVVLSEVEGIKKALQILASKDVAGNTVGEVLENFALQYEDVVLSLVVEDEEGETITAPTIVVKTGDTIGSGTEVTVETDGTYKVKYGPYNFSVAKDTYTTQTGVLSISYYDASKNELTYTVVLEKTPVEPEP